MGTKWQPNNATSPRSTRRPAVQEVQLVEEEQEVLKDVGRDLEAKVVEDLMRYELDEPSSDHFFLIDANLEERERTELLLNKWRNSNRQKAITEIFYSSWLFHRIVVKKKTGKWRVCVDFTRLNRACPKDYFPLLKIDQLVDSTSGHARMSFLDAYRGYHQIAMHEPDQEKTIFITPRGIYCYKVMPFGYLASAHRREESSKAVSSETRLELGGPEIVREPPQVTKTTVIGETTGGLEVTELPHIDLTLAWKILNFPATNNKAEYKAFIAGLLSASKLKIPELHFFSDSKLVVNQVTEKFVARGVKMVRYLAVAKNLLTEFKAVKIEQVRRDQNSHADALVGLASIFEGKAGWTIAIELLSVPSLKDNGTQFIRSKVKDLFEQLKIESYNSTLSYLQCNGHAEATNKTIMNVIKKRLEKAKGKWDEEMPNVSLPTIRTKVYHANHNEEVLARDLDLADERREDALIRMANYQKQLAKIYNQKVQHRDFTVGGLVLRRAVGNTKDLADGKLGPNWEGPYKIIKLAVRGTYYLEDSEGK
ncbi:hypothetical protein Acr_03g0012800 [Actinidia rufa]|uniref:Uncharacterized protein n=1 Tax=Actinidia rufa TaxID=165716 RepID=A0A7J0EEB4_9ERIC|nr:hypothetical protein Acr_03g0012800 [Actinidia rufa]